MRHPVRGRQAVPVREPGVGPVTYQLVVQGEVADRFAMLFNGMRFTRRDDERTTIGRVADRIRGYACGTAHPIRKVEKGTASWLTTGTKRIAVPPRTARPLPTALHCCPIRLRRWRAVSLNGCLGR